MFNGIILLCPCISVAFPEEKVGCIMQGPAMLSNSQQVLAKLPWEQRESYHQFCEAAGENSLFLHPCTPVKISYFLCLPLKMLKKTAEETAVNATASIFSNSASNS